jgi:hypothetical protein
MRRTLLIWSVCCAGLLALFSCQPGGPVGDDGSSPSGQQLGDTLLVDVAYGRDVTITRQPLIITFTDVLEESRCPQGVDCMWEGNAKIRITLQTPPLERMTMAELNTNAKFPTSVDYDGREITLVNLLPYPVYGIQTEPQQYVATLRIVKK